MIRRLFIAAMAIVSITALGQEYTLRATKYHAGYHGTKWYTASGARIDKAKLNSYQLRWVALSPDMFSKHGFKMGDTIVVNSPKLEKLNGTWVVQDRMGKRHHMCIDFLLPVGDNFNFKGPVTVTVTKKKK